jgi:hypothetical protein
MALELTQLLTEMSTRNLPVCGWRGGKAQPTRKADNLTAICEPIIQKMWDFRRVTFLLSPRPITGIALLKFLVALEPTAVTLLLSDGFFF